MITQIKKSDYTDKKKGQAAVELAIFGSLLVLAFSVVLMYGQRLDTQQHVKMEAFRKALQKAYERNGSVSYTLKREGRSFNLFGGFGQGQPSTESSTASVLWQKGMPGQQVKPGETMKPASYAYYAINDQEIGSQDDGTGLPRYPRQQIDVNDHTATIWVTPSVWSEENVRTEVYSTGISKQESPQGGINNIRVSDLQDTIQTTLHVRVDNSTADARDPNNPPLPEYVYEGKSYYNEGQKQTVQPITPTPISLGAYARGDGINRIDYNTTKVGTTIHRARQWQTDN